MLRKPLDKGETLILGDRKYEISNVIGDGAMCIVYSACYTDSLDFVHQVNIKECYPYHAKVTRGKGNTLMWESEGEKEEYLANFETSYKKVLEHQYGNFSIHVFDFLKANGTNYIIMDANDGVTYDKENTNSLSKILTTIKLLANAVNNYHENGYLHLDIKPSNFLVYPEPSEHIVLFDMDTITSIKEIKSGQIKCVPFSEDWAAPEQKNREIKKLCPATDLYSIGAILFMKIMGRSVKSSDSRIFAEWDFEGELFDKVNPKIKRLLTDIFRKTISAAIKRRYQSADELIEALDEAIKVSEQTMYLVSNCPISTTRFVGRDDDIRLIDKALENDKVVFLHGEGGIGKSTLAIEYASRRKNIFDAVIFLRYQSSLESLVDSITIVNFEGDFDQKQKELKSLLDENILLIIDNFDVAVDEESEFLEKVLSYNCKLIFTTRTNFDIYKGEATQIEVGRLSDCDSVEAFGNASGIKVDDEDYNQLLEMFAFVGFNTFVIELLGKQVYSSGYTIGELYARLVNGVDSLSKSAKIKALKDGKVIKEKVPEIIRVLFDMSKLSDEKLNALRNLYLLGFLNLDAKTYRKFTNAEDESCTDTLNDLVDLGWVRKSGRVYSLHPLIEELVKTDLKPCRENCEAVFKTIDEYINICLDFDYMKMLLSINYLDDVNCKQKGQLVTMLFLRLDISDESNLKMVFMWLFRIIKNGLIEYLIEETTELFEMLCRNLNHYDNYNAFLVQYSCYEARLPHFREIFREDKDSYSDVMKLTRGHDVAKNALYKLNVFEQEKAIQMLSEYGLSYEAECWLGWESATDEENVIRKPVENDIDWKVKFAQIRTALKNSDDLPYTVNRILADSALHRYQKVAILIEYCENNLSVFYSEKDKDDIRDLAQKIDCKGYELLLDVVARLMKSSKWRNKYYGYDIRDNTLVFNEEHGMLTPVESSIKPIWFNRFTLAAIESDYDKFCQLVDMYIVESEKMYKRVSMQIFLDILIPICRNFEKCYYLLPYLYDALITAEEDRYPRYNLRYEDLYDIFTECVNASIEEADKGLCKECDKVIFLASRVAKDLTERYNFWKEKFEGINRNISDVKGSLKEKFGYWYRDYFYNFPEKYCTVDMIISDNNLSEYDKALFLNNCTDQMVYQYVKSGQVIDNDCYIQLKKILDAEHNLLCSEEMKTFREYDKQNYRGWLVNNIINQAALAAINMDVEKFEYQMNELVDKRDICKLEDLLNYINLSSWILPLLLDMSECEPEMELRDCVGIYERIVSCAKSARNETDIPAKYQLDYDKIIIEYQKKIDELTGKDFSFKFNE